MTRNLSRTSSLLLASGVLISHVDATVTAKAILPRATSTFGYFSDGSNDQGTIWSPITVDLESPALSSVGSFWVDWCGSGWCYHFTSCGDGTVRGPGSSTACDTSAGNSCYTERLFPTYGAQQALLSKVWCGPTWWNSRTYYRDLPPAHVETLSTSLTTTRDSSTRSTSNGPSTSPTSASASAAASGSSPTIPPTDGSSFTPTPTSPSSSSETSQPNSDNNGNTRTGSIAGAVVGGLFVIGAVVILGLLIMRKKGYKRANNGGNEDDETTAIDHDPVHSYYSTYKSAAYVSSTGGGNLPELSTTERSELADTRHARQRSELPGN